MLKRTDFFLLFEDRKNNNNNFLFENPIEKISGNKKSLEELFQKIEYHKSKNRYIAGYLSYDYNAEFYIFEKVIELTNKELDEYFKNIDKESYIYNFKPRISKNNYIKKLKKLKQYLKNGETYQTNFTFLSDFNFTEDSLTLYKGLREKQIVEYGAFLNLEDKEIISLSPELFLEKRGEVLISKPMKGTLKSDGIQNDNYYINQMKNDKKMISENLMIVDLLRNDLTKISKPATVEVENIFEVQKFKTLYQMISTIKSKVKQDIKFKDVIEAMFPCGSITGAPKIRTMEIINELEDDKRGIYTGIIGFITSNNDFTFNIAIRTIISQKKSNIGVLGIGGGILYDSDIESEWEEALLKSKFLRSLNDNITILETIRLKDDGTPEYLDEHNKRLNRSLDFFSTEKKRVKFKRRDKKFNEQPKIILISKNRIDQDSIFRRHKTSKRELYNMEYENIKDRYIDIIYFNKKDNLAEASRHNVYIQVKDKIFTPFIDDGALPGIIRELLLKKKIVIERRIDLDLFKKAEKVYLSNSINGFFEVELDENLYNR